MKTELTPHATHVDQNARRSRLLRDERGAGLVEYAMLAGLIAIAAFGAFKAFGTNVNDAVQQQADKVTEINP